MPEQPPEHAAGCPVAECPYLVPSCPTKWHRSWWRRALVRVASL